MPSYELESSPIWMDVNNIINTGAKPVKFEYRGQVHTEKQDFTVFKILSVDIVRDYGNNIGEHVQVKFKMPMGDYLAKLYPFRANLEMSLKRIQLTEGGDKRQPDAKILLRRYKAVFSTDKNPDLTGSQMEQYDTESANNLQLLDVTLDLFDRSLEVLRIKTVKPGGYNGVTVKRLISTIVAGESSNILIDGNPSVDGIDIVEPDNTDVLPSLVIKNNVHVTSFPTFLQESKCGVYSAGIGTFLQYFGNKHLWFVYPLFNTKRFDTTKGNKAVIFAIPPDKYPSLDRTYFQDGQILKIVATSTRTYSDSADVNLMNKGSGFRMPDARAYMAKPVELTPDGPKAVRTRLNHEVVVESRKDGLNYAPATTSTPSANPFVQYSKVLAAQVAKVDFIWENGDSELICPGMPCSYTYLDNNKPITLKGTIQFTHTLYSLQGYGTTSNIYKNQIVVTMLLDEVTVEQKFANRALPDQADIGVF